MTQCQLFVHLESINDQGVQCEKVQTEQIIVAS